MNFLKRLFRKPITTQSEPKPDLKISKMNGYPPPEFALAFSPRPQRFYAFEDGSWQGGWRLDTCADSDLPTVTTIKLISWNIDFQAPASQMRMARALEYLEQLISGVPTSTPSMILLQEITASDLELIQNADWIRQSFFITESSSSKNWLRSYGTVTLIDRRLHVTSVFRIRYHSMMGRDGLFVDVQDDTCNTLRVCNTHLESLVADPPLRPGQVKLAVTHLNHHTIDAGVMAGDFNAIQEFDKTLHSENGLKDAFLECGGEEGSDEGWTWGMQCMYGEGAKYGCSRMDKIWYYGGLEMRNLEEIGAGVKIEIPGVDSLFVTDHLGLMVDVVFVR